jgi:CHASE3 domain sensor protein
VSTLKPGGTGGLAPRMAVASAMLAVLVGGAFAVLLVTISDLRASEREVTRSREANATADRLEEDVIDLETGVRGFVIARQERFLDPWRAARVAIPADVRDLERLAAADEQKQRAQVIARAITAYIEQYSLPLVNAVRRDDQSARSLAVTAEGKRRIDALRQSFDRFKAFERDLLERRQSRDDTNAGRAVAAGVIGLAGSIVLIIFFGVYLTRSMVQPLRRASRVAGQLAAGDLGARMPEQSIGEIGALEHSFNRMASALEADRERLRRLARRADGAAAGCDTRRPRSASCRDVRGRHPRSRPAFRCRPRAHGTV